MEATLLVGRLRSSLRAPPGHAVKTCGSAARPETTEPTARVHRFAELPTPAAGNDARLTDRIAAIRAADPAHLQRPRTRPRDPRGQAHAPLPQRPHRRRQHPQQEDHAPDARPSWIRPPPPSHPPPTTTERHHRLRNRAVLLTDPWNVIVHISGEPQARRRRRSVGSLMHDCGRPLLRDVRQGRAVAQGQ